jgi:hypothetical protein
MDLDAYGVAEVYVWCRTWKVEIKNIRVEGWKWG